MLAAHEPLGTASPRVVIASEIKQHLLDLLMFYLKARLGKKNKPSATLIELYKTLRDSPTAADSLYKDFSATLLKEMGPSKWDSKKSSSMEAPVKQIIALFDETNSAKVLMTLNDLAEEYPRHKIGRFAKDAASHIRRPVMCDIMLDSTEANSRVEQARIAQLEKELKAKEKIELELKARNAELARAVSSYRSKYCAAKTAYRSIKSALLFSPSAASDTSTSSDEEASYSNPLHSLHPTREAVAGAGYSC